MTGNKIAYKITKFSKTSEQNNSETVTSENDKEIPKDRKNYQNERNTEKKTRNYYDLRVKWNYDNAISKNI